MRVGVIQSNYLPWRGYFDFIADVDLFVVYDDVQFSKGSWRNRNRLKTPNGLQWLTVPVRHLSLAQRICDTEIDHSKNWQRSHRSQIRASLAGAPYLQDVLDLVEPAYDAPSRTISELNVALLASICGYLRIRTPLVMSTDLDLRGAKTERLLQLLTAVGATTYLSGPSARAYLEEERFREAGIRLEYKEYAYRPYPQLWGPFEGAVSIVDTIANCGQGAAAMMKSRLPAKPVAA